jgi:hypothetical protein
MYSLLFPLLILHPLLLLPFYLLSYCPILLSFSIKCFSRSPFSFNFFFLLRSKTIQATTCHSSLVISSPSVFLGNNCNLVVRPVYVARFECVNRQVLCPLKAVSFVEINLKNKTVQVRFREPRQILN